MEDGDTDSLDIKPPQATQRDISNNGRRNKSSKEKKHSKEHKHKERERDRGRDRDRHREDAYYKQKIEKSSRHSSDDRGGGRHRHIEIPKHRDQRNEIREKHSSESNYRNRNDLHQQYNDHLSGSGSDMRYQDYDHNIQNHGRVSKQLRRENRDDKSRRNEYPIPSQSVQVNRSESRERRKYLEVQSNTDPEKELEDLRNRILSKRHKYEKETAQNRYDDVSSDERHHASAHHSSRTSKDHKRNKHFRNEEPIIEVIDSPDEIHERRRKPTKLPTPENEEHGVRRLKLLEAEREMAWRKELAREELETRREKREKEIEVQIQTNNYGRKKKRHHDSEEEIEEKRRHRHHKKKLKNQKIGKAMISIFKNLLLKKVNMRIAWRKRNMTNNLLTLAMKKMSTLLSLLMMMMILKYLQRKKMKI